MKIVDRTFLKAVIENTQCALARIEKTGKVTRGDAAIMSIWDEVWGAMSDSDTEHVLLRDA